MSVRTAGRVVHALIDALREHSSAGWVVQPFGPDGAVAINARTETSLIVTRAEHDGAEWTHASIAHPQAMPTYDELCELHRIAFGQGWAYQLFAPTDAHVNIHENALHLWGRTDGAPALPNFGARGTI